jgi:hypothetical protein
VADDGVFPRRRPACGKDEIEHGPHEYPKDGKISDLRHCAGWTRAEADVCVMLRRVHETMLEKNPPDGSKTFRLECGLAVVRALLGVFLPAEPGGRLEAVFGAELLMVSGGDPGGWRLAESPPPVAAGSVRPLPGLGHVVPGVRHRRHGDGVHVGAGRRLGGGGNRDGGGDRTRGAQGEDGLDEDGPGRTHGMLPS